jgi:phage protein D
MPPVELSKKYSNFDAPKNQISVNGEDIFQKYGISASTLTVEEATGALGKFNFTIDDQEAQWVNTALFEPNKTVEIKMGYANTLEMVIAGEITAVKTVFSSNRGPQIEVDGERKPVKAAALPVKNSPICLLTYGKTLLNFTALATAKNQPSKTVVTAKLPAAKKPTSNLSCTAECIGLPDIKAGVVVALAGLGSKFNQNYLVQKVVHSLDGSFGFRTRFEAKQLL